MFDYYDSFWTNPNLYYAFLIIIIMNPTVALLPNNRRERRNRYTRRICRVIGMASTSKTNTYRKNCSSWFLWNYGIIQAFQSVFYNLNLIGQECCIFCLVSTWFYIIPSVRVTTTFISEVDQKFYLRQEKRTAS